MDKNTRDFLLKVAEELKEEAKRYYLKKAAAVKIIDQVNIIKQLQKGGNDV